MRKLSSLFITCLLSLSVTAGPWIPVGDSWLRGDIEYLADSGVLKTPITTWPLMWSNIKQDMDAALRPSVFEKLSKQQQNSLLRVRTAFRQATENSLSAGVELASESELLRGFADTSREESSIFVQRQYMDDNWAYNLNLSLVNDPFVPPGQDKESVRLDGSYITGIYDNIAVGVGWIDMWWGAGWDSTLILSNNARPRPGIFVQRNYAEPFESDWLSWIGPWSVQGFVSVLDDERVVDNAKHLGVSVTFKPLDSLEIGLRRTAQWGGEGRPQTSSSLLDLILGRDNCGSGGIDACGTANSNEPGNQLASVDLRWTLPTDLPMAVYLNVTGEDEANYWLTREMNQLGVTGSVELFNSRFNFFLEYSDTSSNRGGLFDYAYNHYLYRTGYRYAGRTLGSTVDNDSRFTSFGFNVSINEMHKLEVIFKNAELNVDNAGFHPWSPTESEYRALQINYENHSALGKVNVFMNVNDNELPELYDASSNIGVKWTHEF